LKNSEPVNGAVFNLNHALNLENVSSWTKILIWAAVIGAIFAYLWWQGQIKRLATYVLETREELKKCSWPTWDELKGSTLVISISIGLLGLFVYVVDKVFFAILFQL
jgi:preprotein translocase subunit SecE